MSRISRISTIPNMPRTSRRCHADTNRLRSVRTFMSIARWPPKNLRSVRTLMCHSINIKVLKDLEKRQDAFFYRHPGPHGLKGVPPLHSEPLRRTQTALILEILFILKILLQTTKKRATGIKPMARLACSAQHPKRSLFRSGSPACL